MEQSLEQYKEEIHEKFKDVHMRIDGLQITTDTLVGEIKGLREDITPITDVFNTIQVYLKGGKFLRGLLIGTLSFIATLGGLTWVTIQIINFFK